MKYTLLLGSNLGDRLELLNKALNLLETTCGELLCQSLVYETTSWGFDAPSFLNQAVVIRSTLDSSEFLQRTQQIEKSLGRRNKTTGNGYASREIDIDILFVDNLIVSTEDLIVPHPRLHERRFVLVPLAEIVPDKVHPVLNKTVLVLLGSCLDRSDIHPFFG